MMKNKYPIKNFLLISSAFAALFTASCKKDNNTPKNVTATPVSIGLYEQDSSIYKILGIQISKIGTQTVDYALVFDTGSGGMVLDANGILPASMISSSGFTITGDSVVVNGITVTNQTSTIVYGVDSATTQTVYGNLAYAPVTVGDGSGNIVIKRLPFFLYYKAVDASGTTDPIVGDFDTFGVNEEYITSFSNNVTISSPFSYYDPGNGLTRGFKMAALGTQNFSSSGYLVPSVITVGLTTADLSSSSGFNFSSLYYDSAYGYAAFIPAKITYNNKTFTTEALFDTGTEPYSYLEDPSYNGNPAVLPDNSPVNIAASSGFNDSYTTSSTENLTIVENPNTSGGAFSVIGLEFFLNNSYLYDYIDHKLGLKNN
jgi:hypothetical protein